MPRWGQRDPSGKGMETDSVALAVADDRDESLGPDAGLGLVNPTTMFDSPFGWNRAVRT